MFGTGCLVRSVRRGHSSNFALPPTTRKSAVFFRDWRSRAEPETVPYQWECRHRADCFVGSGVRNAAGSHIKASFIAPGSVREDSVTEAGLAVNPGSLVTIGRLWSGGSAAGMRVTILSCSGARLVYPSLPRYLRYILLKSVAHWTAV